MNEVLCEHLAHLHSFNVKRIVHSLIRIHFDHRLWLIDISNTKWKERIYINIKIKDISKLFLVWRKNWSINGASNFVAVVIMHWIVVNNLQFISLLAKGRMILFIHFNVRLMVCLGKYRKMIHLSVANIGIKSLFHLYI